MPAFPTPQPGLCPGAGRQGLQKHKLVPTSETHSPRGKHPEHPHPTAMTPPPVLEPLVSVALSLLFRSCEARSKQTDCPVLTAWLPPGPCLPSGWVRHRLGEKVQSGKRIHAPKFSGESPKRGVGIVGSWRERVVSACPRARPARGSWSEGRGAPQRLG